MKTIQVDLRNMMLVLANVLYVERIEYNDDLEFDLMISPEVRSMVEGLALLFLKERTPGKRFDSCAEDYLEEGYPEIIDGIRDGSYNSKLEDYLQDLYDYLEDMIPKVDRAWSHWFVSDNLVYKPEVYIPRRKQVISLSEFEQYLHELHSKEGEYVGDTLRLIDQFKCNRVI